MVSEILTLIELIFHKPVGFYVATAMMNSLQVLTILASNTLISTLRVKQEDKEISTKHNISR